MVVLILVVFCIIYWEIICYLSVQVKGQLSLIINTVRVEKVLNDRNYPDSLKQKLILLEEIRQYAFDSLGLTRSDNYTTYYEQHGKPILWIVTASYPYELKPYEWTFPIAGKFSYKGFFRYEDALAEEKKLKEQGFDTSVDEVSAWSTLGFLKDPVLSSMLTREPGSLANLIIHELTHGTLYVKDNVDYNENLASFVGDVGAKKFMAFKYGLASREYERYEKSMQLNRQYSEVALRCADRLDSLYKTFTENTSMEEKHRLKSKLMKECSDTLYAYAEEVRRIFPKFYVDTAKLNNAYFIDFRRYRAQQNIFEEEFKNRFNSDFKKYIQYLKQTYPSL